MGSRIARGDTAARERIAIASALHVGGTSGEKSRPPVHRGGAKRGVGGSPSQVGNVRVESFRPPENGCFGETIAEIPAENPKNDLGNFGSTHENHGRCLDALCAICRHRWRGGGSGGGGTSLTPPTCSGSGRIGRADVNSVLFTIASLAPTLAATLAYAATTHLAAFPATSMVATDTSPVYSAALQRGQRRLQVEPRSAAHRAQPPP